MSEKNNLPTIGLSMIVRNEEKVIIRCLNSIWRIVDNFTIVDTGSTDRTKAIIKQFFAGKKISGEIYDHKWVNYEDARNYALKKSKDKTDFSFAINASNTFNIPAGFDTDNLRHELSQADVGILQANNTVGSMYTSRAFWRNSKPFRYFCATHEVLLCDEPTVDKNISNVSVTFNSDGKTWEEGREKFRKNIKMLSDYIDKNGLEPRHVFYLAESYKDAGEPKKAIEWYEKRWELGGWIEEMYYSRLMIAGLKWELNYPIYEIADEYMRCGEIDTMRAEHLYHLKRMYEKNNRPQCAIKIGELLVKYKNPYPERILFLNPLAYNHNAVPAVESNISPTGFWKQEQADFAHIHSPKIAEYLSEYLEKDKLVIDAGCGLGFYLNHLKNNGFKKLLGIEGFRLSNFIFDGDIKIKDLTQELNIAQGGNVVSLEVGEHIPKEHEQAYLDNITNLCNGSLIISWAVVGQGGLGHVNEQPNEYIKDEIIKRGFIFNQETTDEMRKLPEDSCWYFRNTLMAFERN